MAWPLQYRSGDQASRRRLTIQSSRDRFAVRLISGVRRHMKLATDAWSAFALSLLAAAALIFIYKPFPNWSGVMGFNLVLLAIATSSGRDGYSSDKPAPERSIHKAWFWVAVVANVGVLLAIASDA